MRKIWAFIWHQNKKTKNKKNKNKNKKKTYFRLHPGDENVIGIWTFNIKLGMVKMCSTWPFLNKYALSYKYALYEYGNGQKSKIWILSWPWSKCIHSNLKQIIIPFKQNLDITYRLHGSVSSPFLVKMVIFVTFCHCGVC